MIWIMLALTMGVVVYAITHRRRSTVKIVDDVLVDVDGAWYQVSVTHDSDTWSYEVCLIHNPYPWESYIYTHCLKVDDTVPLTADGLRPYVEQLVPEYLSHYDSNPN